MTLALQEMSHDRAHIAYILATCWMLLTIKHFQIYFKAAGGVHAQKSIILHCCKARLIANP